MGRTKKIVLNDQEYDVVTLSGLAQMCARSVNTFRMYEKREILPPANIRMPDKQYGGKIVNGDRVYTMELAVELAKLFRGHIAQGIKIHADVLAQIQIIFRNERQRIST